MERILISWVGASDLSAFERSSSDIGPLLATLRKEKFSRAYLPYNYPEDQVEPYLAYLSKQTETKLTPTFRKLSSPIHFGEIHRVADETLRHAFKDNPSATLSILLSPGTPAMQAVWILLGKTHYPCTFYQSSREEGVQQVDIPFNIAAEYAPDLTSRSAKQAGAIAAGSVPIDAAFKDILTCNPEMNTLKTQATIMAARDVPILIQGDTGTGKELFATAIHNASTRKEKQMVIVNCGAIPSALIDSTLFGHKKGAFTGANKDEPGYFDTANGSTLFLDEFGELPAEAQVRLLRVLQNGEVLPVGSSIPHTVDVRIIAATNRNLIQEVAVGRFRADLFYRIAVGVLHLPPLRQRSGDMSLLADHLMEQINKDASGQPGYIRKKITVKAKRLLLQQPWPGNVRELYSTLLRASLWSSNECLEKRDLNLALFQFKKISNEVLDRTIGNGFKLQSVIGEVAAHYIRRALRQTNNNKTQAARLLGLSNYQTLTNWIKRYKVKL